MQPNPYAAGPAANISAAPASAIARRDLALAVRYRGCADGDLAAIVVGLRRRGEVSMVLDAEREVARRAAQRN